jgi:hypothetical protein
MDLVYERFSLLFLNLLAFISPVSVGLYSIFSCPFFFGCETVWHALFFLQRGAYESYV